MGRVFADVSVSLDGFITGPNDGIELPLAEGGERLHEWVYDLVSWRERHGMEGGRSDQDAEVLDEAFRNTGAMLMGRRMFDVGEGPWGDTPPFHVPVFVLPHHPRETLVMKGDTSFTFITGGLESALGKTKTAAGDKDVSLAGGANIIQQFIQAGLPDEIQIHLVPVLLGEG